MVTGETALILANHEEYYAPYADALPERARDNWRRAARRAAAGATLWGGGGGGAVLVLPAPPDPFYDWEERLGGGKPRVVLPLPELPLGAGLCRAVLSDEQLLRRLLAVLAPARSVRVAAWGETPELHELLGELRRRGAPPLTGVGAAQDLWKSELLGTKAGFRLFAARHGFLQPPGKVAANLAEAAGLVGEATGRGEAVVVKPDRGVAGAGQLVCREKAARRGSWARFLAAASRSWPELSAGLLVVERYVGSGAVPRSVSAQCHADGLGGGGVRFLATHRRDGAGRIVGAVLGRGALDPALARRVARTAAAVCRAASAFGVAGVFGLDFAVDADNRPWLLELNARRTTLTAAADVAEGVYGPRWAACAGVALAEEAAPPPGREAFGAWEPLLRDFLFPMNGRPEGFCPFPALGRAAGEGFAGGVALSRSPERASQIADGARERLG